MATSNRKKPTARRGSRGSGTGSSGTRGPGATAAGSASARPREGDSMNEPAGSENSKSAAKRLFDLRWLIAGMFVVYGIVLMVTGIFDSQAELDKAAGVRINLWTGIGMFVVGLVFAAWARWRPLRPD